MTNGLSESLTFLNSTDVYLLIAKLLNHNILVTIEFG